MCPLSQAVTFSWPSECTSDMHLEIQVFFENNKDQNGEDFHPGTTYTYNFWYCNQRQTDQSHNNPISHHKTQKKLRLHSLVTTVIDMTEKICCCIVDSWDPLRSKFSTPGIAKILQITGNLLQFMDFTVVSSCVTECMKLLPI